MFAEAVVEDVEISYLIKSLNFEGPKVTRLSPKQFFSFVLAAKSEDCQTCHKPRTTASGRQGTLDTLPIVAYCDISKL